MLLLLLAAGGGLVGIYHVNAMTRAEREERGEGSCDGSCDSRDTLLPCACDQSQECYYQNIAPGENIEYPEIVKNKLENKLSEHFTVVTINISKIDWLYLSSTGHTRVKFLKNNGFTGQWIAP